MPRTVRICLETGHLAKLWKSQPAATVQHLKTYSCMGWGWGVGSFSFSLYTDTRLNFCRLASHSSTYAWSRDGSRHGSDFPTQLTLWKSLAEWREENNWDPGTNSHREGFALVGVSFHNRTLWFQWKWVFWGYEIQMFKLRTSKGRVGGGGRGKW